MKQARLFSLTGSGSLPIVEDWFRGAASADPLPRNPECTRCELGRRDGLKHVCAPALGEEGGALVVFPRMTVTEDSQGPFTARGLRELRDEAEALYPGPVRFAYAVSCPSPSAPEEKHADACASYLAAEFERPTERAVLVGEDAVYAATGHRFFPIHTRRAWVMVRGVPCLIVPSLSAGSHNAIVKRWISEDLKRALLDPLPAPVKGVVRVLASVYEVRQFLAGLDPQKPTVVDVENAGSLWKADFSLLCLGLCQDPEDPVVIPAATVQDTKVELRNWLDSVAPKIGQNLKYDRLAIWRALGADLGGVEADTMIWCRLLEADAPAALGTQAWRVGMGGYKKAAHDALEDDPRGGKDFSSMEPDALHRYNGLDTSCTLRLYRRQLSELGPKLITTWRTLWAPATWALGHVERWGAKLSEDNVRAYDRYLIEKLEQATAEIAKAVPLWEKFNPASNRDIGRLLYDELKLPCSKLTPGGQRSVAADVLEDMKGQHPVVDLLLDHALYRKQQSAFGLRMLDHVGYDGRVHVSYTMIRSGRLSARDPNIQQIPTPQEPGDGGTWARGCWVAERGHTLVNLDYGQMELRCAAMLSGDEEMAAAFERGTDFHRQTAAMIFAVPPEQVTKEQRKIAKSIAFGMLYGQTDYGLSMALGIEPEQAKKYVDAFLGKLPKLNAWRQRQIRNGMATGVSVAEWGSWYHRRRVTEVAQIGDSKDIRRMKKHAANVCLNNPIQNVANCFSLAALAKTVSWILDCRPEVKLTITVHDSLVLEVPDSMVEEVARKVRGFMLSFPSGNVKMAVDVEVGKDWGTLKPLDLS